MAVGSCVRQPGSGNAIQSIIITNLLDRIPLAAVREEALPRESLGAPAVVAYTRVCAAELIGQDATSLHHFLPSLLMTMCGNLFLHSLLSLRPPDSDDRARGLFADLVIPFHFVIRFQPPLHCVRREALRRRSTQLECHNEMVNIELCPLTSASHGRLEATRSYPTSGVSAERLRVDVHNSLDLETLLSTMCCSTRIQSSPPTHPSTSPFSGNCDYHQSSTAGLSSTKML